MKAVDYINDNMNARKILDYYEFERITENDESIRCCCKIHNGDNPTAFYWNKSNNLWICYTGNCGGGDVFTLIEKMEHCNFLTAVKKSAEILGLNIDNMEVISEDRIKEEHRKWLANQLKKNNSVTTLEEYSPPLTKGTTVNENFKRFDEEILKYYNASFVTIYPTERGLLHDKLIIPIYKKGIRVGDALRDTSGVCKSKWYYVPYGLKISNILYNEDKVNELVDSGVCEIILVEGIFDVWAYHRIGIDNVVAVFGSSVSEKQYEILIEKNIDITLSFDNDNAGNKTYNKTYKMFKNKATIRKIELNEGSDPADETKEYLLQAYLNRHIV